MRTVCERSATTMVIYLKANLMRFFHITKFYRRISITKESSKSGTCGTGGTRGTKLSPLGVPTSRGVGMQNKCPTGPTGPTSPTKRVMKNLF